MTKGEELIKNCFPDIIVFFVCPWLNVFSRQKNRICAENILGLCNFSSFMILVKKWAYNLYDVKLKQTCLKKTFFQDMTTQFSTTVLCEFATKPLKFTDLNAITCNRYAID